MLHTILVHLAWWHHWQAWWHATHPTTTRFFHCGAYIANPDGTSTPAGCVHH